MYHALTIGLADDLLADLQHFLSNIRTLPIKDKTENNILLCSYPKFFPL